MLILNKFICWIYGVVSFGKWKRLRAIALLTTSPPVAGLGTGYSYGYSYGYSGYRTTGITDSTR